MFQLNKGSWYFFLSKVIDLLDTVSIDKFLQSNSYLINLKYTVYLRYTFGTKGKNILSRVQWKLNSNKNKLLALNTNTYVYTFL